MTESIARHTLDKGDVLQMMVKKCLEKHTFEYKIFLLQNLSVEMLRLMFKIGVMYRSYLVTVEVDGSCVSLYSGLDKCQDT